MIRKASFCHSTIILLYFYIQCSFVSRVLCQAKPDTKIKDQRGGDTGEEIRYVKTNLPEYGQLQGYRFEGMDFFGNIPYVAPPVGDLRFAPPEPALPWDPVVRDATSFGHDCWQVRHPVHNNVPNSMSEDCLTLNVFTPAGQSSRKKLLPVMVFIHGGAFEQGGGNRPEYHGKGLVEGGLLVVTLNYRLGALGFLVSSSDELFGNLGLMDQRAALYWISSNIRFFGGDPKEVTLVGESAGATMISLHLMMEGAGKLFHRVIMQSNPLGYTFRTPTVANMIGEAFKQSLDCKDLASLRSERVEDLMKAQASLRGVPRSVGDFFTWAPTLTTPTQSIDTTSRFHSAPKNQFQTSRPSKSSKYVFIKKSVILEKQSYVNVSQPLSHLDQVPAKIPVIIGSNKHEGEIFVYNIFPAPMSKVVYWTFVGGLFKNSALNVIKHYRPYVEEVENEADELARKQVEEEENYQYYNENEGKLEQELELLRAINATRRARRQQKSLLDSLSRGGGIVNFTKRSIQDMAQLLPLREEASLTLEERRKVYEQIKNERIKAKKLKQAAKVVRDFRPVLSRIINDYLFRCPSLHYAHRLSGYRRTVKKEKNVYVYRFSQPTHLPGYKECWGKSCHTSELPYVFQAMPIIRSNYSTLGPIAEREAPSAPEYPYTDYLAAYRRDSAFERQKEFNMEDYLKEDYENVSQDRNHTYAFRRVLNHFFGDYFKGDADESIASDMSKRWGAFTRTGNPNYDESECEWLPLRHQQARSEKNVEESQWTIDDIDIFQVSQDFLSDGDEDDDERRDVLWSEKREDRALRRSYLDTLKYEVAEEDRYRTELRRKINKHADTNMQFESPKSRFPFLHSGHDKEMTGALLKSILEDGQQRELLGIGLQSRGPYSDENAAFFPEMLELKWPPEGRIVERDCTCDMWNEINYEH